MMFNVQKPTPLTANIRRSTEMSKIFADASQSVGATPLVRLNRVVPGGQATVLAKIEGRNPAYSVKDRIGTVA